MQNKFPFPPSPSFLKGPSAWWLPLVVSAAAGQVVSMVKAKTPQSAAWSGAEAWQLQLEGRG
jgi:hypothetical protein